MTFDQTIFALKQAGTEQNRKIYARHGVKKPMFGVSWANFGKLKKRIKIDHELALKLWKSGNHDAQILATMIADPQKVDAKLLEAWAKELDCYVSADALAKLADRTPLAGRMMRQWIDSRAEFIGEAGWHLVALTALDRSRESDEFLGGLIDRIEREIHKSKNRVKHGMNMALIAIGGSRPKLTAKAIAAAKHIGRVEVDHGETGCKTPEAIGYIEKMVNRRKG
jgi:3-methyladenine DNA glycosylase AlkD